MFFIPPDIQDLLPKNIEDFTNCPELEKDNLRRYLTRIVTKGCINVVS